ncbi:hypothetical protein DET57_13918 [Klebsiella oxytoca]|uniref:DUF2946 domain-containing protein n=1 Tax=Klebsiella oxytoca TaxID=571 RepID=A0A318F4P7_KLEOX|nr:DUF2946 domain-containing protein [Klebsiella oxytoca]PXW33215.1 hypothetical protein DET57_13918 [Klebsiella oxytoca]
MVSNIFHQSASRGRATWLALFAILLIVVAPLISISLQKDPMSGMHHAMIEMQHNMSSHEMVVTRDNASVSQTPHHIPADHAQACGYCVLLTHVPGLIFALVLLVSIILRRQRVPVTRLILKHLHDFHWLYPHTRAPPTSLLLPLHKK